MAKSKRSYFAELFDEPFTSDWHQRTENDAWIGGIEVPYYLARLQEFNYFDSTNEELIVAVERYVAQQYSPAAAVLFRNQHHWSMIGRLLKHRFFVENGREPPGPRIEIAACEEYLKDPHATDETLARRVGTTLKQIQRYGSSVAYARRDFNRLSQSSE